MAHTPGPWLFSWEGEGWEDGGLSIVAHQLGEVCYIDHRLNGFYQDHERTPRTHEDQQANANLIAAAPELLAALKMAVDLMENYDVDAAVGKQFRLLTDAIDKAEGRAAG